METPNFVPVNTVGKILDIEYTVTENDLPEALTTYKRACKRLLNPPIWQLLSANLSAEFLLFTNGNNYAERLMQEGDFLRIDIPGPGSKAGDGYDWVRVETIQDNVDKEADESIGITVRSAENPGKPGAGTAHFFKEGASSTFIIKRTGNTINACYYGRNELPNTQNISIIDKLRNGLVAAGALAGISNLQWSALLKGLLAVEIGE